MDNHRIARIVGLKLHGSIFQSFILLFFYFLFFLSFEESSLQKRISQIAVEKVFPCGCTEQFCTFQLPISYCVSLIMVTITRHVFIISPKRKLFSAVKFAVVYE